MRLSLPPGLTDRHAVPSDHPGIIAVMKDWWGGRDLTYMLPRLFLNHFSNTSFVVEKQQQLVAFLIGFMSPSLPEEGYIHFAGVDPRFQKQGIGSCLYHQFFRRCHEENRRRVRACTSPVNKDSIAFHTRIGFSISPGDSEVDGIPVTLDYNKPGDPKVLFEIALNETVLKMG